MTEKHNGLKSSSPKGITLADIVLIAGLGNPGDKYKNTYHNVGLAAEDHIAGKLDFVNASTGTFAFAKSNGRIFVRPLVFMNESGVAIRDALRYFSLAPNQILIIHDDADIPLGEVKIQFGRGEAGHHGIESIAKLLGTKEFWRARVGIEQKTMFTKTRIRAEKYVLKPISRAHMQRLISVFEEITHALAPKH